MANVRRSPVTVCATSEQNVIDKKSTSMSAVEKMCIIGFEATHNRIYFLQLIFTLVINALLLMIFFPYMTYQVTVVVAYGSFTASALIVCFNYVQQAIVIINARKTRANSGKQKLAKPKIQPCQSAKCVSREHVTTSLRLIAWPFTIAACFISAATRCIFKPMRWLHNCIFIEKRSRHKQRAGFQNKRLCGKDNPDSSSTVQVLTVLIIVCCLTVTIECTVLRPKSYALVFIYCTSVIVVTFLLLTTVSCSNSQWSGVFDKNSESMKSQPARRKQDQRKVKDAQHAKCDLIASSKEDDERDVMMCWLNKQSWVTECYSEGTVIKVAIDTATIDNTIALQNVTKMQKKFGIKQFKFEIIQHAPARFVQSLNVEIRPGNTVTTGPSNAVYSGTIYMSPNMPRLGITVAHLFPPDGVKCYLRKFFSVHFGTCVLKVQKVDYRKTAVVNGKTWDTTKSYTADIAFLQLKAHGQWYLVPFELTINNTIRYSNSRVYPIRLYRGVLNRKVSSKVMICDRNGIFREGIIERVDDTYNQIDPVTNMVDQERSFYTTIRVSKDRHKISDLGDSGCLLLSVPRHVDDDEDEEDEELEQDEALDVYGVVIATVEDAASNPPQWSHTVVTQLWDILCGIGQNPEHLERLGWSGSGVSHAAIDQVNF